jgi:hypothetical protein
LKLHRLLGILTLALCAGSARADRLIWIPTAGVGRIQGEYMAEADGKRGVLTAQAGFRQFELLGRLYKDFEDKDRTEIGGQYVVLPEGFATPGVAVGVWDVGDNGPRGRRFFGVVSKSLEPINWLPFLSGVKVHGGIGSNQLSGLFFGAEAGIPLGLRLYAEYDSNDWNAGLSWSPLPLLSLKAESWDGDFFVGAQIKSPL